MPIVCLHGLGRDAGDWAAVSGSLDRFGAVQTAVIEPEGGTVLVGHSYAGPECLRIAARYPDRIAGVILTNSFFPPARNGRTTAASVSDYLGHRVAVARQMAARRGRPNPNAEGARGLASLARLGLRPAAYHALAARVSAPVLVVHARDDHYVPVDFALAAAARHPSWDLELLETGRHSAHVERPDRWLAAVEPWLESRACAANTRGG